MAPVSIATIYAILLHCLNDSSEQKGFAIVPDDVQRARSTALDWEPLFLKTFPMFGRNMLHAIAYPEEDSPQFEYKGTAFTCMEAALGPDVNANLLRIKEWWEAIWTGISI